MQNRVKSLNWTESFDGVLQTTVCNHFWQVQAIKAKREFRNHDLNIDINTKCSATFCTVRFPFRCYWTKFTATYRGCYFSRSHHYLSILLCLLLLLAIRYCRYPLVCWKATPIDSYRCLPKANKAFECRLLDKAVYQCFGYFQHIFQISNKS